MSTEFQSIKTSHTGNGDSNIYRVPRGGALLIEGFWAAGTGTLTVYSRANSGGTFVPTVTAASSALAFTLDTSNRYWRQELLANVGTEYKITISSASSFEADTIIGRVIAE